MLQKLDTEHLNRLALADALASMEPQRLRHAATQIAVSVATPCACLGYARLILVAGRMRARRRCKLARLFPPIKRGSYSRQSIVQSTTIHTPIHRMRHEWCDISRPPIPLIGALAGKL